MSEDSKESMAAKRRSTTRLGMLAVYEQLVCRLGVAHPSSTAPFLRWCDVQLFLVHYCCMPSSLLLDSGTYAAKRVAFRADARKGAALFSDARTCDAHLLHALASLHSRCEGLHAELPPSLTPLRDAAGYRLVGPHDFVHQLDVFVNSNIRRE